MFKVGYRYLPNRILRCCPWWNNPDGYEVFMDEFGYLYCLDNDGDERDVDLLDETTEMLWTLEN